MTVSAYRAVTVGVCRLDAALALFRDVMQLRVESEGALSPARLRAWGLPPTARARFAELSCRGYPVGRLRLVEYDPAADTRVRLDHGPGAPDSPLAIGPKAIDFYVADPIDRYLERVVRAGYAARSAPRRHQIGQSISEEVVVSGPDGVPMLLMVGHRHAPTSLRPGSPDGPFSEIATASVICGDLAASRRFYGDVLGLVAVNDAETPPEYRELVCELVDAPPGTRVHFLLYAQRGEPSGKILLIHFHDVASPRLRGRMRPGHLGFSLFSHACDDVDELVGRVAAAGGALVAGPTDLDEDGRRERIALVRGPNEEMFEFVQHA